MNFARQGTAPWRRLLGITAVVLLHVAAVYGLMSGLARRVVEVVRSPIQTRLIEPEKKTASLLRELAIAPPPKLEAPPPPVIAPPRIRIAEPPPPPSRPPPPAPRPPARVRPAQAIVPALAPVPAPSPAPAPVTDPVIAVAAPAPVATPPELAPAPAPAPASPAPRPQPTPSPPAPSPTPAAPVTAGVACANYSSLMGDVAYPRDAMRQGIEQGEAVIQFTLTAGGEVTDVKALSASNPIFARNSIRIVSQYGCRGQGRDLLVTVPFGYRLQ